MRSTSVVVLCGISAAVGAGIDHYWEQLSPLAGLYWSKVRSLAGLVPRQLTRQQRVRQARARSNFWETG